MNRFWQRTRLCLTIGTALIVSVPLRVSAAHLGVLPVEHPTRLISVWVNGSALMGNETAILDGGRVLLPLRPVFAALGLEMHSVGRDDEVLLPSKKSLRFSTGSTIVWSDRQKLVLETPVQNYDGRLYAPLQLFRLALGAIGTYDARNAHVTLVAGLPQTQEDQAREQDITATVSNVDRFSDPPSVSLVSNGGVRTLLLRPGVAITTSDIVARTRMHGDLQSIHVGDILTASFSSDGSVAELDDSYRSRSGRVAAVSAHMLALDNGQLVIPSAATTVMLNAAPAKLGDVHVGDFATIRSNPESLEVREILVARPQAAQKTGAVVITQCAVSPLHPLHQGEELDVFLRGTSHGIASFDLGGAAVNVPMRELTPGLYQGRYLITAGTGLLNVQVVGHLTVGAETAQSVSAPTLVSAATLMPQVMETAPRDGQVINSTQPSIYATFVTPTGLAIDPASIMLVVNGANVSRESERTSTMVHYVPGDDLPPGPVHVQVTFSDLAGNGTVYRWTFIRGTH